MKISVAMTTYNGGKYIVEQLDSIRAQTTCPDEVIICDDMSTDNTVVLVNDYIQRYCLDGWLLIINECRLGWERNFRKAISLTNGDVVFFSDQDDIWFEDKIQYMLFLMQKHHMGCLYGACIRIDGNGDYLRGLNANNHFTEKLSQIHFKQSFFWIGGLGCCMVVSRKIVEKYLELNFLDDDHDYQCARIAVYYDTLWYIDRPVIKYRIHEDNTSGISHDCTFGTSTLKKRIESNEKMIDWLYRVTEDEYVDEKHNYVINRAIEFLEKRNEYLTRDDKWLCCLFPYYDAYGSIDRLIGDFAYKHEINHYFGRMRWEIEKLTTYLSKIWNA